MIRKFNFILIIGLTFLYAPSHAKEISQKQAHQSSTVEELAEEMNHLNSSLDLLSTTISNLIYGNNM